MKQLKREKTALAAFVLTIMCALPAVAQSDETAKRFHVFPQLADGGGWQSVLLVTNAAQSTNLCTLELHGLTIDRFEDRGTPATGSTATFSLIAPAGYLVWPTKNELALASGYATLDCTDPVVAQVLYASRDGSGTTTGMATVFSSQAGTVFQFPVLTPEASLGIAIANDTNMEASCRFVLDSPEVENLSQATHQVTSQSNVARFLSAVIQVPGGFTEGSATVSCDQQVSVIGLQFDGAIFTTLPPVVLNVQEPERPGQGNPDLTVYEVSVTTSLFGALPGALIHISATVLNSGDGDAAATTLRYYRSSDATITTSDTQEGTSTVAALSDSGSSAQSVDLPAPSTPGTYYYGACVDAVPGESDATNNCSGSVKVTVHG